MYKAIRAWIGLSDCLVVRRGNAWNAQKDNFRTSDRFAWSPGRFNDRFVVRGGYGLNYNQEEIAFRPIFREIPAWWSSRLLIMTNPPRRILASSTHFERRALTDRLSGEPNTVSSFGSNGLPANTANPVNVSIFPQHSSHHAHPTTSRSTPNWIWVTS